MATFPATGTKLGNLVDPRVYGEILDKKLTDLIKFAPLARIDMTLQGRPGSTIYLPYYTYIGDAADVAEGVDIAISQLTETSANVQIKKIGKAVQITDEAVLSGYGDPIAESIDQIALAIASKVDADVLTALSGASLTFSTTATEFVADDVSDALVKFGEDIDGEKVLLVDPEFYNVLRKAGAWIPASEIAANRVMDGVVGEIYGCQVVVSNKLKTPKTAYIVKPNALAIYMKRDTNVETDRDILNKSTVIAADKNYVAYLYDDSKAIKMSHA